MILVDLQSENFGASQEASNRLMLRWLKTVVVSDEEKAS
jgi:hypothetical protein